MEALEARVLLSNWSGPLTSNTTFVNTQVQNIVGNVDVKPGVVLTVQPGTIVQFSSGTSLTVDGTLLAQGTTSQTIVFTSFKDNSASGGSNTANPGDWGQILFTSTSTGSMIDDAVIKYGGGAEVEANDASPTIENTTFANASVFGVQLTGSDATLTGDTFLDDGFGYEFGGAMYMDMVSQPVMSGITFTDNNQFNGVALPGGSLPAGTTTWNNPDVVYWLEADVTVPVGSTLVIDPGQIIKLGGFGSGNNVIVDGTLNAQGTAAAPVIFTSKQDDSAGGDTNNDGSKSSPSPYDWGQIEFAGTSTNDVLNDVTVRYGSNYAAAEVVVDDASPTITNCTFSNSGNYGVVLTGSDATLTGDTFQANGLGGDGSGAIDMDQASQPVLSGLTFTGNFVNGVSVEGGSLPAGTTKWNLPGAVFWLNANVTVPTGSTLVIDPGLVLKFGGLYESAEIVVQGGLQAEGTAAQPIIFTSKQDESAGGNTNNAGSTASPPGPGNWSGIQFTSTSTANVLDYVEVRYGGQVGIDNLGCIETDGAPLTMDNSIESDGVHVGLIALTGSDVTLESDVFAQNLTGLQLEAGSTDTVVNNTIDGNAVYGVILDSPTATLVNDLITNSGNAGVIERSATTLTMSYCDVYNPSATSGNYSGLTDPTGTDGNLSVDPKYFNEADGQYELQPGSPVAGAGTSFVSAGVLAPTTDVLGNPVFKDPNITGRGDGSGYDIGAYWPQQFATSNIDLATLSVTAPTSGTEGGTITVNWTVQEEGSGTATGSWSDAVYLSDTPVFSPDAQFLTRVEHTGSLGPGESYSASASVTLNNVLPGNHYILVRCNDLNDIFEGLATANNTAAAPISFALPSLTLNTPYSDQFTGAGESNYYQLAVPGGQTLVFSLNSAAASGSTELYVSRGVLPLRSQFDYSGGSTLSPNQQVVVPTAQPGTYYVLAYAAYGSSASSPYTLTAQTASFGITGVSPNTGGNAGSVTVDISGTGLNGATQASLVSPGGTVLAAAATQLGDASQLYATFNLTGLAPGKYGVQLTQGGTTLNDKGAFTVITGTPGHLSFQFNVPGATRSGQEGIITVDWVNDGGEDIAAPILDVQADNATMRFSDETTFDGDTLEFLAINGSGPAGVLPPGATGSIQIPFVINTGASSSNFTLSEQMDMSLNWSAAEANLQPPNESTAAWDAIYANFMADVGTTVASFQALLDKEATYLSQLGEYTGEEGRLLALEFQQAADFGAIDQDYTSGAFGLGVPDPTNITATADSSGNVTIQIGGEVRDFTLESNGSYQGAPGDTGVLTLTNGAYQIREADGTIEAFGTDGRLSYVQDTNGNRTSAVYSGSQLTQLVDSDGETTTFTYNSQGLVTQITDPTGETTNFTYDAAGEHLLSITYPSGTESFTYVTGQGAQSENAVQSITFPGGTHEYFTYDSRGRLIETTADGGADPVTYSYDGAGGITTTDGLGDSTTECLNEFGNPGMVEDALGNVTRYFYDADQNLTEVIYPNGSTSSTTYDAQNNPTSSTDQLGNTVDTSFDPALSQLLTLRDPDGNTLSFTNNAQGDTTAVTFPDGTSQQYAYDAQGNVTQLIERNGQAISYTYNSDNLLTSETFSDGTSYQFSYDNHENLISATDPTGTTTFTYNSADDLTNVTYPDGSFLEYTYNAAGERTQMEDQTGFTVNYIYNALGQLSELTDGSGNLIVSYSYDAVGRLSSEQYGNGTATDYTYDGDSDVTSIVNLAPGGSVQSSYVYTYNNMGLPVTMTTAGGTFTYGYDGNGQLTSVTTPTGETITYQYDAAGNRIAVVDNGATTQYTTNDLDEYTQVGNTNYKYDANGDLISQTDSTGTTTYSYNALGQLVSVVSPTSGTTTFQYDALGYRVSQTQNGQVTKNLIDPISGTVVGQFNHSGGVLAHYTHGLGLTSQVTAAGTANYYNFDLTGNTTQLTGPTGTVLNSYSYLPFGELLTATGTAANPFTYVGQSGVMSVGGGLYSMGARVYDSTSGRFTTPDPTGLSGGDVNFYRYVGNTPTSNIDPAGLWRVWQAVQGLFFTATGAGSLAFVGQYFLAGAAAPLAGPGLVFIAAVGGGFALYAGVRNFVNSFQKVEGDYISGFFEFLGYEIATQLGASDSTVHAARGFGTFLDAGFSFRVGGLKWVADLNDKTAKIGAGLYLFLIPAAVQKHSQILSSCGTDGLATPNAPQILPQSNPGLNANVIAPFIIATCTKEVGTGESDTIEPDDPNDLFGPQGFGPQDFVPAGESFPYTILFENKPTATAPAETVVVTEQLAANLDWSTFQLGSFGFGSYAVDVPAGRRYYSTRIDATATVGEYVDVTAGIDLTTGLVTWTFSSIDPTTGAAPTGLLAGFLPPDDSEGDGEGFVTYSVAPNAGLTTGTTISAQASVVFDTNAPLNTPTFVNTIDTGPPTSTVTALPAASPASFTLSWSGQSDPGGSGIASYTVYVSEDGGPFTWLTTTSATSTTFTGQVGHSYGFYSVATDNVGNVQPTPSAAQATTFIAGPPTSTVSPLPATETSASFVVSWSGSPGSGASSITSYEIFVSDNGGAFTPFLAHTTATSATFTGQYGNTYRFYSVATNNLGLVQPTPGSAQATTTVSPPVPPVITGEQAIFTRKTNKKGKPTGKAVLTGFDLTFSAPLNAASATNAANYHVDSITTKKVKKKVKTILHPITKFTVSYSAATDSVDLTLIGTQTFPTGGQLTVDSSPSGGVTGASGAPLGGTTVFSISKKGNSITPK
jgi:RHS repeat-associated protein